ncbi:DeoR/GlpR family DNA-binding transcription regulator [Vagococcus jeotgali]|uniref:DeoR/GlpR family DNA-binding transcription regulator n=1 Tax=Vagococcus jeotgali TaxID=3109030 RepID=UPI002DD96754|nr:DeoR/GlpR family DNA-binding transcription regulator [Vagococcus sp. B2T-5]
MLTEERQAEILKQLQVKKVVKVRDLIKELDVSESTIRRDLQEMEEAGLLVRIHGGAKQIVKLEPELTMAEKSVKNTHEKREIAQFASEFVQEGEYIYLDAGTTTLEMLPYLKGKNIHLITNSVKHALLGTELGITTTIIGGQIRGKTTASVSQEGVYQLEGYFFDRVFMGVNGIHPVHGYTTADSSEASMKKAAISQTQHVYFLADATKFDKLNFAQIARIETGTLVTNKLNIEQKETYENLTIVRESDL